MTNKLLIANRGEIALRVLRTAQRMGRPTVALYTDLDVDALHRAEADEAVWVPSYLDIEAIVAAATATGATQIHPGYGFLSERPEFAHAVAAAGLTLVGPSAEVMERMGRKDAAREIALAAGVPVVPSYVDTGVEEPRNEVSRNHGGFETVAGAPSSTNVGEVPGAPSSTNVESMVFPVLVKAAAGGGGKGMRVVRSADELPEAMAAAARESAKAFGDDTLLIEKYVESGRHIEVQVFGDTHGSVVHLFERDCSTQRRHQKVLEEAPAPTISAEQREAITTAAVALAREVGYVGAGTVEFLLDNATGDFYFLEMNTRLQVEHPVTEEVVRVRGDKIDLVELQVRVADGESLGFEQGDVTLEGHAIEARVYAEDSFNGFLPQAGRAGVVRWPRLGDSQGLGQHPAVRVDEALRTGQVVSTSYDPMLGKVIAWGATRDDAVRTLVHALDGTRIFGLTTNAGFLRALVDSSEFRQASIDTSWLDHHEVAAPSREVARVLGALAMAPQAPSHDDDPWAADGFRMSAPAAPALVQLDELVPVGAEHVSEQRAHLMGSTETTGGVILISADLDGDYHEAAVVARPDEVEVVHHGERFMFVLPDPFDLGHHEAADGELTAPMPGAVLQVVVAVGDQVAEGQVLAIMEAMKMELTLKAPFDGVVASVDVAVGDQVALGARLLTVESSEGEA